MGIGTGWITSIEFLIMILIGVAYITLAERKVMAAMQRRIGPNIVGPYGILQPIADGVKLLLKELIIPKQSNKINYILGPILTLFLSFIIWVVLPISSWRGSFFLYESPYGIIYIFAISSLSVFLLLFTGWSSNSKYTFIGAIRSISQLISYEVSLGLIVMSLLILNQNFNLVSFLFNQIYLPYLFPLFPLFFLFLLSALAETNRPPFDLPEAESELVAGVLTEYSAMSFAALYLAEYSFLFSMSLLTSILFFGHTSFTFFIIFIFLWARSSLPRIRFDQLMNLGWTKILPFSVSFLLFIFSFFLLFN